MEQEARIYKAIRNLALACVLIGAVGFGAMGVVGALDSEPGVWSAMEPDPLNESLVEAEIQQQINDERVNASLIVLEHDRQLQNQANDHTERMAVNGVLSHQIGPSTAAQRLGKANCGFGAENIAQSAAHEEIAVADTVYTTDDEATLAASLVATWMDSEPHRQNILTSEFRTTAVSVEITESGDVYATQMFCESK